MKVSGKVKRVTKREELAHNRFPQNDLHKVFSRPIKWSLNVAQITVTLHGVSPLFFN